MAFLPKIAAANRSIFRPATSRLFSTLPGIKFNPISRRAEITSTRVKSVIKDSDDSMTVWIAFPGISKDEIKLSFKPNHVCVDFVEPKNSAHRKFFRGYPPIMEMPVSAEDFKLSETKVEMKNGLLQLIIPKI